MTLFFDILNYPFFKIQAFTGIKKPVILDRECPLGVNVTVDTGINTYHYLHDITYIVVPWHTPSKTLISQNCKDSVCVLGNWIITYRPSVLQVNSISGPASIWDILTVSHTGFLSLLSSPTFSIAPESRFADTTKGIQFLIRRLIQQSLLTQYLYIIS